MPRFSKRFYCLLALVIAVSIFVKCTDNKQLIADPRGPEYAGAASCRTCHQAVYDSFLLTSHQAATSTADLAHISGTFEEGKNVFSFNGNQQVKMERRGSKLFQVLYVDGLEKEAHPFDIGFGKKNAQTWLYWKGNNTYQLPVSYYTTVNNWGTSPGYSLQFPSFDRLIGRNCFECHSSNIGFLHSSDTNRSANSTPAIREAMDRKTFIAGIDCERCHGPSAQHVRFHTTNPGQSQGRFVTRIMAMSRQQQLDACALCHAGNDRVKLRTRFDFHPGDTLTRFLGTPLDTIIKTEPDVHGNQYGLLTESRCFTESVQLTCNTCHDPHRDTPGNLALYSSKCLGCHQQGTPSFCKETTTPAAVLLKNCIDCHMPNQPSSAISFYMSGSTQRNSYYLRTHKIGVYWREDIKK